MTKTFPYKTFLYLTDKNKLIQLNESIKKQANNFKDCKGCGLCCIKLGVRCPFLSEENECKIYKHRPFFCRYSVSIKECPRYDNDNKKV